MNDTNDLPELAEIYPIGIKIIRPFQLPFDYGQYPVEIERRPCTVVFVEPKKPEEFKNSQIILVLFPGVTYNDETGSAVNEERVKEFYKSVVSKKHLFRTSFFIDKRVSREVEIDGEKRKTRDIYFKEEAAVYEIGVEAINKLILASRCAVVGLFHLPLVDEDYLSGRGYESALFLNYVPRADTKIQSYPALYGSKFMKRELFRVSREDYENEIRQILANRKDYVIEEMLVSANNSFHSGEYEAGLILLEAVFEAIIKEKIKDYYGSFPDEYNKDPDAFNDEVDGILGDQRGIRHLIRAEYPKCKDAKWFCEGVPEYGLWDRIYKKRNDMIHHIYKRGRLTKEEALQMFEDFDKVFMYLFERHSSLIWGWQ